MIQKFISSVLAVVVVSLVALAAVIPVIGPVSSAAEQSVVSVAVAPRPLVLSCVGPAVRIGGASGADTSSVELIDRSELSFIYPELIRTSETDWRVFRSDDNIQGTEAFSGYQYQIVDVQRMGGETMTNCQSGKSESWLLSARTTPGNESLLILTNPDSVSALVDIDFYGTEGYLGSEAVAIAPGEVERLNLARYAPGEVAVGLKIASQGARVAAFSQHKSNIGLSATGISVSSAWQPGMETDVLSVLVGDEEYAPADRAPTLYLLNPSSDPVAATISATSSTGGFGSVYRIDLVPGVNSLLLDDLAAGFYHLSISSGSELLASVFSKNSLQGDFNWQAQAETFERDLLATSAVDAFLSVKANSESVILVRRENSAGFLEVANRLSLKAGESAVVAVTAGSMIRIQGSDYKASIGSDDSSVGMTLFDNQNSANDFSFRVY